VKEFFKGRFTKIKEINRRYAKPRVKMTKGVKIALLLLRLYLILLVGILILKFIVMVRQ
jgi:hypothetical protein